MVEEGGIKFLVHDRDKQYFEGKKLDYYDSEYGGSFDVVTDDGKSTLGNC